MRHGMIWAAAMILSSTVWAAEQPASESLDDATSVIQLMENDRAVCIQRLQSLGDRLDANRATTSQEQSEEKRNALLRENQMLNELRSVNQIRLNELNEQLRQRRAQQLRKAFGEQCTLTLEGKEAAAIPGVRLVGVVDVAGQRMLQFRGADGSFWTVDPKRIVMVQITTAAK